MKRIISLILVLATAFLTLTGCAFRYDKKDMSKYAEFDAEKFYNDLQKLTISLGDFSDDPATRETKVKDAVAAALLKVADTTKRVRGTIGNYDSVYYCYYATDGKNIFFANTKLDQAKPTNAQLGLSTLTGVNAEIAKALTGVNIENSLYTTTAGDYVQYGDIVSVSYIIYGSDGTTIEEQVWNQYLVIDTDNFSQKLLENRAQVGVELPNNIQVMNNEGGTSKISTYGNVKVESIVKAATGNEEVVVEGDTVRVSFTMTFDATKLDKDENDKYVIPEEFKGMNATVKGGVLTVTASYIECEIPVKPAGDPEPQTEGGSEPESQPEENKSFVEQLVGKKVGSTTATIIEKGVTLSNGKEVDVTYSDVKVHWIDNTTGAPITVKYTPYPEEYNASKSNEKTETNSFGEAIRLNGVELTYYVFPVYYIDVVDALSEERDEATLKAAARVILKNCYSDAISAISTSFSTLKKDEYTNATAGKTVSALVTELPTLISTYKDKKSTTGTALTSLTSAQKTYATTSNDENKTKLENAETTYQVAKDAEILAEGTLNAKIEEIVACKSGETSILTAISSDYKQYQYDTLDAAYRKTTRTNLAKAITEILKSSVTFKDNLPKRAVKQAYNALMDSYQYKFYEGNFSGTDSTTTITNYSYYGGNFNNYLIATVVGSEGTLKDAKNKVMEDAKEAVKDIMYVYIFTQMVENAWDTELSLTKEEKHNVEDNLAYQAYYYEMYGYVFEYDIDEAYNGAQFDKVMGYLLAAKEVENDKGVKVDSYANVQFNK